MSWNLIIPSRSERTVTVHVAPVVDGVRSTSSHEPGDPVEYVKRARRFYEWRHGIAALATGDPGLSAVLERSVEDLGALRIFDNQHPDRTVVAAGAPWFTALFGRDSILTSWMLLPLDSSMTVGTLQTLADHQGVMTDVVTEEQPGRILHEIRLGLTAVDLTLGGGRVYYGTADATSLFVMLLGELARWGGDPTVIKDLLPHADRALDWIENTGDRDGFVEYQQGTDLKAWSTRAGRTRGKASASLTAAFGPGRSPWPRCRHTPTRRFSPAPTWPRLRATMSDIEPGVPRQPTSSGGSTRRSGSPTAAGSPSGWTATSNRSTA